MSYKSAFLSIRPFEASNINYLRVIAFKEADYLWSLVSGALKHVVLFAALTFLQIDFYRRLEVFVF